VSAKHKRPFYIFAAVAAVCCMVLVTSWGSKAQYGRSHVTASPPVAQGAVITLEPEVPGGVSPSDAESQGGGTSAAEPADVDPEPGASTEGSDTETGTDPRDEDLSGPAAGEGTLDQPDVTPSDDDAVDGDDQGDDDQGRPGRGRGHKKDRDHDNGKDEPGQSEDPGPMSDPTPSGDPQPGGDESPGPGDDQGDVEG
jgi:hypothetical protein